MKDPLVDVWLMKEFEWCVLPRVGETIHCGEEMIVTKVWHDLSENFLEIWCEDLSIYQALAAFCLEKKGWEFLNPEDEDMEIFLELAKKCDEREKQLPRNPQPLTSNHTRKGK